MNKEELINFIIGGFVGILLTSLIFASKNN